MFNGARDVAFVLLLTAIVRQCRSESGCPDGLSNTSAMKRFRDSCYQFVSEEKFWFGARDYCRKNGGRLVRIDDEETNDFIVRSLNDLWWRNNGVWIGLHDLHGEMRFQWAGVNPFENDALGSWTNWGRGHPGAFLHSIRDCVRMVRENGQWKWHETVCSAMKWHYRSICQYKAEVNVGGVLLALTQHSPSPPQQDNRPSPLTTRTTTVTTAFEDLTTTEEMSDVIAFLGEKQPLVEAIPDGQNQEKDVYYIGLTTDAVTEMFEQTLDENILIELEKSYDYPELAEIKSQHDATEYDERLGKSGLGLIIFFCSAVALSLLLAAILLIRRRRNQKLAENVEVSNDVIATYKKSSKKDEPTTKLVVSNIYVTDDEIRGDVKRSSRAADDVAADDNDVTGNYDSLATSVDDGGEQKRDDAPEMTDDCGMMGYDMPRPSNVYDEIPELSTCLAAEDHEYESLDDVIAKVSLDDVIAKESLDDVIV